MTTEALTLNFRPKFARWVRPALAVAFCFARACPKCADKIIDWAVDYGVDVEQM